ncbi:hypothetical protein LAZ67_2004937, partial [Cordylochernes scorpioides]
MRVVHLTEKREVVLEWMVDLIQKESLLMVSVLGMNLLSYLHSIILGIKLVELVDGVCAGDESLLLSYFHSIILGSLVGWGCPVTQMSVVRSLQPLYSSSFLSPLNHIR